MFDISVVIVNWNTKDLIRDCLRSIKEDSEGMSVETVVVDNDSSDGSPEAIRREFSDVQVVETGANLGFGRGNNIGIRRSSGRHVCMINSDVVLKRGCLKAMLAFMDGSPDVGMAGPRLYRPDGAFLPSGRRAPSLWASLFQALWLDKLFPGASWFPGSHLSAEEHNSVRDVEVLVGCFWMVRREAVDQVGGLDERFFMYGEDNDWCVRFRKHGWRVVYYPPAEAIHVGGGSSSKDPVRFLVEKEKSEALYWKKHAGCPGQACYALIAILRYVLRLLSWGVLCAVRPSRRRDIGPKMAGGLACLRWLLHV